MIRVILSFIVISFSPFSTETTGSTAPEHIGATLATQPTDECNAAPVWSTPSSDTENALKSEQVESIAFQELDHFQVATGTTLQFFVTLPESDYCELNMTSSTSDGLHFDESAQLFTYRATAGDLSPVDVTFSIENAGERKAKTITLYPFSTSKAEHEEVFGFSQGNYQVDENGGFNYSLQIAAPAGPSGFTPQVGLSYSSNGSDGIMGVGWSMSGLSTIGKSPSFIALDDKIRGIKNDGFDQFNLDGLRLLTIKGGVTGGNGTEYRTESNHFSRIFSYTSRTNRVETWKVQTKTGLTYDYGLTNNSLMSVQDNRALFWAVSKITDTNGNYAEFEYLKIEDGAELEFLPKEIRYGANDQTNTGHTSSIKFDYEDRPDIKKQYINGQVLRTAKRLKTISVFNGTALVRTYNMEYHDIDGTNTLTKLKSITEGGASGGTFRPLEFDWVDNGEAGLEVAGEFIDRSKLKSNKLFPLDVNRDGLLDMVVVNKTGSLREMYINESGTLKLSDEAFPELKGDGSFIPGDYNGDGRTDLFWFDKTQDNSRFHLGLPEGGYGEGIATTTDEFFTDTANNELFAADGNGDGYTDFIRYNRETTTSVWLKNQSTPGSFRSEFTRASDNIPNGDAPAKTDIYVSDFNSDGLADILLLNIDQGFSRFYENETENGNNANQFLFKLALSPIIADDLKKGQQILFGNWNGDNLQDVLLVNTSTGEHVFLLNKGDGNFEDFDNPLDKSRFDVDNLFIYPTDFNGDGFTDLVTYVASNGSNGFYLNKDNFTFDKVDAMTIPKASIDNGSGLLFGDWTGKGVSSVFWWNGNSGENALYTSGLQNDNLINKVRDGAGQEIRVEYSTLGDEQVYQSDNSATHPLVDFQGALSVVKSYSLQNGNGGRNTFSYKYANGKLHLQGRGFRGFERVELIDNQTNVRTVSIYDRSHLLAGNQLTLQAQITQSNDTLVASYYTNKSREIEETNFSYVEKLVTREFELNGNAFKTMTQSMTYDNEGNTTSLTIDYGDGNLDRTTSEYQSFTEGGLWILGRLTKNTITRELPNGSKGTRVAEFAYDPQTGLLNKQIVEPDNGAIKIVTTHTRDQFGNIVKTEVEGNNGYENVTRTTLHEFDPSGRYTIKVTNPEGHVSEKTYDPLWGFVASQKDINGLVTEWTYDEFGRKVKEKRADDTELNKSYNWCSSGNCPAKAVYFTITNESGNTPSQVYFDQLGREVRSATQGFDGSSIFIDKSYDNLGNLSSMSEPYFEGETPFYTRYKYDIKQRPVEMKEPGSRTTTTAYNGLVTTVNNSKGQKQDLQRDAAGKIIQSSGEHGQYIDYTYDPFGNLIETQDPGGNIVKWGYDNLGRNISLTDPDLGTETYVYNSFGELIKKVNSRGQETTYKLDKIGRTLEREEEEGTTKWSYDGGAGSVGKIVKIEAPAVTSIITYDALGRMTNKQKDIEGVMLSFSIDYDQFSRPSKLTYPAGFEVTNVYNDNGYLSQIVSGTEELWKLEEMNARGQVALQSYGNGSSTRKSYEEETGWLREVKSFTSDTTFQHLAYAYDDLGNLDSRENRLRQLREVFEYDRLNRLTRAQVGSMAALEMRYDQLGNLVYKSDVGEYEYGRDDAGPHAVTSINGSGIENWGLFKTLNSLIEYSSFQKATQIANDTASIVLSYDDVYQRVKVEKKVRGRETSAKFYFDHWFEVERTKESVKYTFNIRALEGTVAQYEKTGDTGSYSYWYKDHLGSVETIAGDSLSNISSFSYDAWGRRRDPTNWISYEFDYNKLLERGFTGHEHYDLVSLIDMNGRVYDPVLGRFTSPDPFIQDLTDLQAFNRYSYTLNNPLSLTDPSGYFFSKIFRSVKKFVKRVGNTVKKAVKAVGSFIKQTAHIVIPVAVGALTGGLGGFIGPVFGLSTAVSSAAGFGFGFAASSSLLAGASLSDALKNGVRAGLTSGISKFGGFDKIFNQVKDIDNFALRALAHGTVQGVKAELTGGEFSKAFITDLGNSSQLAIVHIPSTLGQLTANVLVGGTVSELTGDKFRNGAISEAMLYLYNEPDFFRFTEDDEGTLAYKAVDYFKQHIDWSIDGDGNLVASGDFGSLIGGVTYDPYNNQIQKGKVMGVAGLQSIPILGKYLQGYVLASRKYSIKEGTQSQVFTTGCMVAVCFEGIYKSVEGGSND